MDYFLAYISQFYEIVIFTSQHSYVRQLPCLFCVGALTLFSPLQTAMPVLDSLDRYNFFITHKLFREATRSVNGQVVKVCRISDSVRVILVADVGHGLGLVLSQPGPLQGYSSRHRALTCGHSSRKRHCIT